jgi:hypothetical protein
MKTRSLSVLLANTMFSPTILAYFWTTVDFVIPGLVLYAIFSIVAYRMGLFGSLSEWPRVSKTALFLGPLLIVVGVYFSTQRTSYWMILPGLLYTILVVLGGLALRGRVLD